MVCELGGSILEPTKKLSGARDVFLHDNVGLVNSLDGLTKVYRKWVNEETYCSAEYIDHKTNEVVYGFWKASKRGNDVYADNVRRRLKESLPSAKGLNKKDLLADGSGTNCLHVVLTVNPKQFLGSLESAWNNISCYLNKFLNAFRGRYGRCWVLRSFEAHESGFPHVHLFIISEHNFDCEWFKGEDYDRWLIPAQDSEHKNISGNSVSGFEDLWSLGFVYSRGVGAKPHKRELNFNISNYVFKDVVSDVGSVPEDGEDKGALLSLALNWLFRKQSFSISGVGVLEDIFDLIGGSLTQIDVLRSGLLGRVFDLVRYEFVKFCGIVHLANPPPDGYVRLSEAQEDSLDACAIGVSAGVLDVEGVVA